MDDNYFNANSLQPRFDPNAPPGLAGALYAQQQQRYQQAMGLQQLMQQQKASDYMQDAPVRAETRLGDMAFQRGRAATAEETAREDLAGKVVGNRYNEMSLKDRVRQQRTTADKGQHDFDYQRVTDGIQHAAAIAEAYSSGGPSGHAAARQKLKELNIDENDPVVNFILSGADADEVKQRADHVQARLHSIRPQYAQAQMTADKDITKALLEANSRLSVAEARTPRERHDEWRKTAYQRQVKLENPSWNQDQIDAEAVRRMDAGQYGIAKPTDNAETKELEDSIGEMKKIVGLLPENQPFRKQLERHIQLLESQRRRPNAAPAAPAGGQPGVIKLN